MSRASFVAHRIGYRCWAGVLEAGAYHARPARLLADRWPSRESASTRCECPLPMVPLLRSGKLGRANWRTWTSVLPQSTLAQRSDGWRLSVGVRFGRTCSLALLAAPGAPEMTLGTSSRRTTGTGTTSIQPGTKLFSKRQPHRCCRIQKRARKYNCGVSMSLL